jgi:hypothetical protein
MSKRASWLVSGLCLRNDMGTTEIERQARKELIEEAFRAGVEAEKARLLEYRPWWKRVFPWKITIERN